jgi:hypothetical protein
MNQSGPSIGLRERESEIVRLLAEAATVEDATHEILAALAGWGGWDVAILWVQDEEQRILRCGPPGAAATVASTSSAT